MNGISGRDNWIFGTVKNILEDKEYLLRTNIIKMLNITTRMFKYTNLPDTIPVKDLEIQLQVGGFNIWKKVDGKLYTFRGGLGGAPNPYYLPTIATVANPALNFNKNLKIDEECVVMLNDHFYQGLMPLNNKYGSLLTEAEMSLRWAIINARIPALIQADNDNTYESAVAFFDRIVNGEKFGIISSNEFFDGIKTQDFSKQHYIKDIIESVQYIKGSWFNEMGVNAAFNMKREAINEAEASLNEDILYPTIDTMLECRRIGLEKVNVMYDENIGVELDSVWLENRKRDSLVLKKEKAEIESITNESEEIDYNETVGNANESATD